jgi:putative tryptophan/tyrosine transport system substrate-binding protein
MSSRSPDDSSRELAAFRKGLAERDYVEGRNVTIEYRWAQGRFDRLPALAKELVNRPVAVLAALGDSGVTAKAASATVPIIFGIGGDPVASGLVPASTGRAATSPALRS